MAFAYFLTYYILFYSWYMIDRKNLIIKKSGKKKNQQLLKHTLYDKTVLLPFNLAKHYILQGFPLFSFAKSNGPGIHSLPGHQDDVQDLFSQVNPKHGKGTWYLQLYDPMIIPFWIIPTTLNYIIKIPCSKQKEHRLSSVPLKPSLTLDVLPLLSPSYPSSRFILDFMSVMQFKN